MFRTAEVHHHLLSLILLKGVDHIRNLFWWWHVGPATDKLVLATDPLHGGWNLSPHSITDLVGISYSFCIIVVLVSVWRNSPCNIVCWLGACFYILHIFWGTLMEFVPGPSPTIRSTLVEEILSQKACDTVRCDICGGMHSPEGAIDSTHSGSRWELCLIYSLVCSYSSRPHHCFPGDMVWCISCQHPICQSSSGMYCLWSLVYV